MKWFKKIFILLMICIFIADFSSSYSSLNIDNLIYVLAIGIDKGANNTLEVTFQFSNPLSVEASGSEKAETITNTVTATSISDAINSINSFQERQLNLSHCKIVIFSEELSSQGISDEIYTLINDTQIRPSSNIVVCKSKAKDYIEQTKPEFENLISKYYETLANSSKYTGKTPNATLGNFFNALICKSCEPYAILGSINGENSAIQGNNKVQNLGVAVFKNDTLVGELNTNDTISFLNIKNSVNRFLISIPDPLNNNELIDLYVSPTKPTKIEIDTSTSTPYIKIKCYFSARIYSMAENSQYLSKDVLAAISNSCNSYIESMFLDYLYKTSKNYKSDISGFGNFALKNFLTTQDYDNYNWRENYKNSFFHVNVDTSVKSGMLITAT